MGFCILGGKEGYLRKSLSDKLTSLGQTVGIGAAVADFTTAIQNIYTSRYTAGQDSLKVDRKLTLTSSQTGSNVNIADNWYTTCDASAVYTAGQNSVKTSRKLTLSASQTGTNIDIADNWYTTCDASAVYNAGSAHGRVNALSIGKGTFAYISEYQTDKSITVPNNCLIFFYWSYSGRVDDYCGLYYKHGTTLSKIFLQGYAANDDDNHYLTVTYVDTTHIKVTTHLNSPSYMIFTLS